MMKVDQILLRGKSANQIKHILLAESMQKQKAQADQQEAVNQYFERRKRFFRSSSESRDLTSCECSEGVYICKCDDVTATAAVCRQKFSSSLTHIRNDLSNFTYNTEELLHGAR